MIMTRSNEFLVVNKPEKAKAFWEYEMEELRSDISVFSEEEVSAVRKFIGKLVLSPEEQKTFKEAVSRWWYDKYGFDYDDKPARVEMLMKKYAPPEDIADACAIQEELFDAYKKNDGQKIEEMQRMYEERYPDQLEGLCALFGIGSFLDLDKRLDAHEEVGKERREIIGEITRYQYLLTHFIAANGNDKEFLRKFWEAAEQIAKGKDFLGAFNKRRRGILSQVAVLKVMEKIGAKPKLSHPREDAEHAIDVWIDAKKAVQVKGIQEYKQQNPEIMETEMVSFPGVEIERGEEIQHFNSALFQEFQQFQLSLDKYRLLAGKNIKGYMMVVPYSEFDAITGEPSEKIVAFAKEKIHLSAKTAKRKKGWL